MIAEIKTIADVETFARHLVYVDRESFHPDDDFNDTINIETKEPFYTPEAAALRNKLMKECFEVCKKNNVEVYDVMYPITWKEFKRIYEVEEC